MNASFPSLLRDSTFDFVEFTDAIITVGSLYISKQRSLVKSFNRSLRKSFHASASTSYRSRYQLKDGNLTSRSNRIENRMLSAVSFRCLLHRASQKLKAKQEFQTRIQNGNRTNTVQWHIDSNELFMHLQIATCSYSLKRRN